MPVRCRRPPARPDPARTGRPVPGCAVPGRPGAERRARARPRPPRARRPPPRPLDSGLAGADTGLAGADGFASRPPRPSSRDTGGTTATTEVTRGAGASPGRHRRAGTGPGRDGDEPEDGDDGAGTGPGRRAADTGGKKGKGKKPKRKGSFWRELPLLIVVAIVLTFVIQTFLARIYVIPSASMERTLHGCNGCNNDRVAVDKITYRFSEPSPGDVVVFRGPPTWGDNGESGSGGGQRSENVLVRGLQSGLSLVGLAPPDEKDFVKRVVATGGQTVACCDPQNRVTVDGQPLDEPYIYYQPNLGRTQADFAPVQVPQGQLWVMGDNRNNSADARVHGPIGVTDVIGKARVIVLPVGRWGGVPDTDPQAQVSALGAPTWTSGAPLAAGRARRGPAGVGVPAAMAVALPAGRCPTIRPSTPRDGRHRPASRTGDRGVRRGPSTRRGHRPASRPPAGGAAPADRCAAAARDRAPQHRELGAAVGAGASRSRPGGGGRRGRARRVRRPAGGGRVHPASRRRAEVRGAHRLEAADPRGARAASPG